MKRFSFKMLVGAAAVCAVCLFGCGGDDNNPADNNGNNTGGGNDSTGNGNDTTHTHDWGDWVVTAPATCDAAGVETRTCKLDASHKETRAIPKLTGAACNPDDGGSSETVSLGGLKWMKNNLNVQTADSWCYDNSPAHCAKYGRLYTWEAATAACWSIGKRLPTREEWTALVTAVGGESTAGKKLKSTNGWNYNGNGTDNFGFSALPGGNRDYSGGGFNTAGDFGFWWTATENGGSYAYGRGMYCSYDYMYENYGYKGDGRSVRCVQDYD
jgi:uncharacterized protein (TIGR02145 family)